MTNELGKIAILGSGETSPNLVGVHRELLEGKASSNCFMIDSPFGFQENADQLVEKIQDFYKTSLNIEINLASFRKIDELNSKSFFKTIEFLKSASFIFAGPGSPSYASKLWSGNQIQSTLLNHLSEGKNALFASAAATTLGENTLPVYEIYKVGKDPFWEKGLNILNSYGLSCSVVPHFNNKEGGNHDTSYSYVGKNRIEKLLDQSYSNILGIDEHTAVIISGKDGLFEVKGIGKLTLINKKGIHQFDNGSVEDLSILQDLLKLDKSNNQNQKEMLENETQDTAYLKQIAKLEIEVENNNKNNERFSKIVGELISLREKLREEKNYELSDTIRNILESCNLQIEDSGNDIKWSILD
mgnify:CR=1 FL=1|jgi:hypothetical protein|tara:strand:+ start:5077 stop:6147 length:1071 start_codon:yes stop_codon:yes gene_type:complete